jgi:DNA polymerase-1
MDRLLIIDGNAILHRAYHAYPDLTNSAGEPVSAVYGFFSMLLTVLGDQRPDYLAICFDRGAPTIRQSMFVGYHSHRPKATPDFISQIGLVHMLLEKMKAGVFELDGYEGDDLIGTISSVAFQNRGPVGRLPRPTASLSAFGRISPGARRGSPTTVAPSAADSSDTNLEVIILTGDRDLLQLVNEHVKVLMPVVGMSKTVLFDSEAVLGKYGVTPEQFVDYKALIGDPSDGYPGVTGIGPKTASSLLQKYVTFENLYEHVGELPEKVGLKLATDAEQAALAKKLATIITDVPMQFDIKKCYVNDFDVAGLRKAFEEQGFKSLVGRMKGIFGKDFEKQRDSELGKIPFNKDKATKEIKKADQLELL